MRILHVAAGLQETCGVSCFVVEIARAQAALGHTVSIVTSMTCGYPVDDLTVELLDDPTRTGFLPDIVHIHSTWNLYVHKMALWCREKQLPYLISPHGALTPWALKYRWWKKIPALLLYQYADYRNAAAFHVTVPEEERDIRRLKLSQPVITAPLGIRLSPAQKETNEYKDILFLGRVHPVKGLEMLLHAWASVEPDLRMGWRIVIAGPDDVGHQEELKTLALQLGFRVSDFSHDLEYGKKQIHGGREVPASVYREKLSACNSDLVFTGPVYSEAKEYLYRSARYFILPSFSENFGVVVLEALAAGTPVITTTGTPWQVLVDEQCGWRVEPEMKTLFSALNSAMSLPDAGYATMSVRAKEFVEEHYSWKNIVLILLSAYKEILGEKNA